MRRKALIVLATMFAATWYAPPASAIQDGTIDTRPYRYPNVVCVSSHFTSSGIANGGDIGCGTGQLIAPRVVLTAAHVAIDQELGEQLYVSTDAEVPLEPNISSMIRVERAVIHPEWFGRSGWQHDIGVLILERPVNGVPFVQLPTEGVLDDLQSQYGSLDKVPGGFTGVGYGFQRDESGNTILETQYRRYGPAYIDGLPDKWLNHNLKRSGVWAGDSGSCVFLGDSFTCVGVVLYTRLDTPSARSFLAKFVSVP